MDFISKMHQAAQNDVKRIGLPEGDEERTLRAAEILNNEKIAEVVLYGDKEKIRENAKKIGVNIDGIEIIDINTDDNKEKYINELYELRKNKGVTPQKAEDMLKDAVYYATMELKNNKIDGLVSGAVHSTGDLLRPGLQIIKTKPGVSIVSSFFAMILQNKELGEDGLMLFSDCGVNVNPTAQELAIIAKETAISARNLCKIEPKVAMLSFSTKGSAKNDLTEKVVEATRILEESNVDFVFDGELQLDAALVPEVAKLKSPDSKLKGDANVLIFPDLQAGNIGYKLVQRMAGAEAIGPLCQGFLKPINDLSRGCSVEDIVTTVAITAVQAQNN